MIINVFPGIRMVCFNLLVTLIILSIHSRTKEAVMLFYLCLKLYDFCISKLLQRISAQSQLNKLFARLLHYNGLDTLSLLSYLSNSV